MNMVLQTEFVDRKRGGDQLLKDGEGMAPADIQHRIDRISGALRLLYAAGESIGSRRLQAAALDAMNAARGLG